MCVETEMQYQRIQVHIGYNSIIILFVLIQFQMSADCNLHGFSPQGDIENTGRRFLRAGGRDSQFYNSFVPYKKYNENVQQQFSRNGDILTREIRIKQGRLKGIVREFRNKELKNVNTFLGIPYAAPPVKSLRFMPPGSPPSWKDVKIFDSFAPVCPQASPDLSHEPFKTMNAGYFNRLKGLMPFLTNQSEDCLYLNIYAPIQDYTSQEKYPVIVYIHGESFEWNSGNPYDGSVLASYGNVVVVTINFRLGILGFLRPGLSEHTVSNFGLLDQIASLQWIKDNIEEFGGDASLVTLMGHGTGAACINFLMVSPVSMASQGLFHKAILMSGTALADWALTHNPLQFTIQVAEALNCPLVDANDEMSNCLRRKRLSEIMSVKITVPEFQTPFGPIVDGSVVPNTPRQVMGVYQNLFTRYEMLYGITEWEAYHLLDPVSLTYGMLENERNEFLRKYMYSRYEALPYFALATTLSEYLDWRKAIPPAKSAAEEHRDLVLDLLSDARFVAPIIQMALYHSKINPKSYLYVFRHKSKMGEFAGSERSISGEEIAYVFGIPLLNEEGPLSHHKFSHAEQLLSESILTYFTNFAKTGNPNAPRRLDYMTQGFKEWQQYDVYWPEYDYVNQSYLALGIPPHVSHHYRAEMTHYWNDILPDLLNNPTKLKQHKPEPAFGEVHNTTYQKPSVSSFLNPKKTSDGSSPWTYGVIRTSPRDYHKEKRPYKSEEENSFSKQMDRPLEDTGANASDQNVRFSLMPYFAAVSVCLLAINAIVLGLYCYRKKRNRVQEPRKNEKTFRKASSGDSLYSVVDFSEGSRTNESETKQVKKPRNDASENQARVKKWIQQEIIGKYSKSRKNSEISLEPIKPITKSNSISEGPSRITPKPKPILKNAQRIYQSSEDLKTQNRRNVQKVSVGIDATPSTRGESVLKQTPIEITKSLDRGILKLGMSESEGSLKSSRRSRTSISLQMLPTNGDVKFITSGEPEVIKLGHGKPELSKQSNLQTFLPAHSEDINVTSRDSTFATETSGDPLENIQKRNFPKVLPDFPESKAMLRLSFPQTSLLSIFDTNRNPPPPPPPRVSTLQRKKQDEDDHSKGSPSNPDGQLKETDEDSATSSATDSSKVSVVDRFHGKSEKTGKRSREQPSIVIQPKIGPTKSGGSQKEGQSKAHINLQTRKEPPRVLDSKGPSDKMTDKSAKDFKSSGFGMKE